MGANFEPPAVSPYLSHGFRSESEDVMYGGFNLHIAAIIVHVVAKSGI